MAHPRESDVGCDLMVVFTDLHFDHPNQDGRASAGPVIFSPRQAFDAAVDCGVLLNREVTDILQRNLNASFSLLRKLAGARNSGEIIELHAVYVSNQIAALVGQGEELATLSIKAAMDFFRSAYPAL